MTDDGTLLTRYAEENAQDAFAELVRRHVDFVYASALRQLRGNKPLAEDVTQLVFIDLARKAARLTRHSALVGWLHTATRYAVRGALRSEARRRSHECDPRAADALTPAEPATDWVSIQPVLDDVIGHLRERERVAILMRFFEGRRLADVGDRLELSETAARSCVDRALEKMRLLLARRGVTSTSAGLALALANHVSVASPPKLAASVTLASLAGNGAGGWGATTAVLLMSKIKIAAVSIVVIAGLVTVAVDVRANRDLRADLASARAESREIETLQQESAQLRAALPRLTDSNPELAELTRLRDRLSILRARPAGVTDSEMKPVANMGREKPESAFFTFMAGLNAGDLSSVASLITFQDDTPAARDAFMASLPEAVRLKHGTPERVFAAGLFSLRDGAAHSDPAAAAQVISVQEMNPGTVRVRLWIRQASGSERETQEKFTVTPQGWSIQFRPLSYERDAAEVRSRFDPVTGEPRGKR